MKKTIFITLMMLIVFSNAYAKEWYEGGTLHSASGLEWQEASFQNKLATCSDFVSTIWQKKGFIPEIQSKLTSMDTVMVLSKELVKGIDGAFEKDPDPAMNKKMYTNQTVSSAAILLMNMMGWLNP